MADIEEVSTPETPEVKEPALEATLLEAFKAAETADTKVEAAPSTPAPETTSGTPEGEKKPEQQAPASKEPPANWSEEHKAAFAKLPPEGQDLILDRHKDMQADYTRKTQELSEKTKFHDEYSPLLKQYESYIAPRGLNVQQGLSLLFNAQAAMDNDPKDALKKIGESYGIKVNFDQEEKFTDPEVAELKKELASLRGQLNQTVQSTRNSSDAQARDAIEEFRSEKDTSGNPKYPHFDKVQNSMATLITAAKSQNQRMDLATAYDKAVRLDDELYRQTLEAREKQAIKARQEEAQRAAEEAKKKVLPKGRNTAEAPKSPVTIEDNLRAAFSK